MRFFKDNLIGVFIFSVLSSLVAAVIYEYVSFAKVTIFANSLLESRSSIEKPVELSSPDISHPPQPQLISRDSILQPRKSSNVISYKSDVELKKTELQTFTNSNYYSISSISLKNKTLVLTSKTQWTKDRNYRYIVEAFNIESNKKIWQYKVDSFIYIEPVIIGNNLYIFTRNGIHVLDVANGSFKWIYNFKPVIQSYINTYPIINKETLFFSCYSKAVGKSTDTNILAINNKTGNVIWKYTAKFTYSSNVVASNGHVYFMLHERSSGRNYLYALDAETGNKKWSVKLQSGAVQSITEHNDVIYFGQPGVGFYAIDNKTQLIQWKYPETTHGYSRPVVEKNIVYFSSYEGYVYALDIKYGKLIWKRYLDDYAPLVVVGSDALFIGNKSDGVSALNKTTGKIIMSFEDSKVELDSHFAIKNNVVYYRCARNRVCLKQF